jgi:hypothetical protein
MANFYVDATLGDDGNAGSIGAPWQTIAKVNASSFSPDDFIYFKCGCTWRETLIPHDAGTDGHQITYGSYSTGAKPIISGANAGAPTTPVRNACVYDTDARGYITIDGLELAYALAAGVMNDQWTGGALEVATPSWIVQNCTFTKCIAIIFGPNSIVQDNSLVGPQPITAADGAIFIRGQVAANCSVLRNTISGFYGRGIWFMNGADTPTANDNIIHDIAFTYGTSGEGYGINFDGYGRKITGVVTAKGNTVYDCAMNGIELENCSGGSVVTGNLVHDIPTCAIIYMNYAAGVHNTEQRGNDVSGLVAYNIIYNTNRGVYLAWIKGVDIWNNVITGGTGTTPAAIGVPGTNHTYTGDFDIRNNVFGDDFSYLLTLPDAWANTVVAFDYNRVSTQIVIRERNTSTNYMLSQLQALGKAMNCFTDDPAFIDEGAHDYHLQSGSPCINAGIDVGLTEDFEGNGIC